MKNNSYKIVENDKVKIVRGEDYNFNMNKETGEFIRWGKTLEDDPKFSPCGPEIADIEISTACSGVHKVCKFCYKSNNPVGTHMSIDTFIKLADKLPRTITQIAFGIGDLPEVDENGNYIKGNPDMWKIFAETRKRGWVPNVTINGAGLTEEIAKRLHSLCGAVAVSLYDKEVTYNAVKMLTDTGMDQVNIHAMISNETYEFAKSAIIDKMNDERLKGLKAIVFLSLKKKGRAKNGFTQLSQEKFTELVTLALENNVGVGFDSCSAFKFLKSVENHENFKTFEMLSEPCESSCFSSYFNVDGHYFPCSFSEGTDGWENGIDIINNNCDFLNDLWFNKRNNEFRNRVIGCRDNKISCCIYEI